MNDDSIIQAENLTFRYGTVEALKGISFQVRRGEIVGLLGPNGAGKTTAIKLLAGILSPGGGRIRIQGFVIPEQRLEAKRVIGYVPESAALYESLSAKEFLELAGRLHGMEEKPLQTRMKAILESFDLDGVRMKRLATYSKGMRQKVLLSAALLHNPAILLLDEPLSGLDVMSSVLIKDLLAALAVQGKTILYSSHVLDVVERVCHRVLIINVGELIADAPTDELKTRARESSLEGVFRKLTHSADTAQAVARVLQALSP